MPTLRLRPIDRWPKQQTPDDQRKYSPFMRRDDNSWRFQHWKTNLRAITKGLEALRLVDRYGITSSGEQYVGWKELPSGIPLAERADEAMTLEEAARVVVGWISGAHDLAQNTRTAIEDIDYRRYAYRQALKHLHPDAGGDDSDAFLRLQRAIKLLDENDV